MNNDSRLSKTLLRFRWCQKCRVRLRPRKRVMKCRVDRVKEGDICVCDGALGRVMTLFRSIVNYRGCRLNSIGKLSLSGHVMPPVKDRHD